MSKRTAKSRLAALGNGLLTAASIASDIPSLTRMTEIEREIDRLQEEYARLNETLDSERRRKTPYEK